MTEDEHRPRRASPPHLSPQEREERRVDDDVDRWLRRAGLPYFVRRGRRASNLLRRVTPFVVYLIVLDLMIAALDRIGEIDLTVQDALVTIVVVVVVLVALLALVGVPLVVTFLVTMVLDRFPRANLAASITATALFVLAVPLAVPRGYFSESPLWDMLVNLGLVFLGLLLTLLGIGSLLSWSVVTAIRMFRALGQMTSLALPLLMLVVVFAFFARALWEVTSTMGWYRICAVAAFFGLLVLLVLVPATRREMRRLVKAIDPDSRSELLGRSGLVGLDRRTAAPVPLSGTERGNITLVLVLAQAFQVAIFGGVVCFFLIVLGQLAFSTQVLTSWLQGPPATVSVLGIDVPFDVALVKTAVFLSCVSCLNFVVSASTNASYRAAFYDPLFAEARVALAVRDAYRGTARAPGSPTG